MTKMAKPLLTDALVRIDPMPPGGRTVSVKTDEHERTQLAERLKITSLPKLEAELKVTRLRGGLHVTGLVVAETIQPCVVSFEPVYQSIEEPVDRVFLPISQRPRDPEPGSETFVDLEGDDPPDYFDGQDLDLSELVIEAVALAIDPYPRAPGAEVEVTDVAEEVPEDSPFAALKGLKTEPDR